MLFVWSNLNYNSVCSEQPKQELKSVISWQFDRVYNGQHLENIVNLAKCDETLIFRFWSILEQCHWWSERGT